MIFTNGHNFWRCGRNFRAIYRNYISSLLVAPMVNQKISFVNTPKGLRHIFSLSYKFRPVSRSFLIQK